MNTKLPLRHNARRCAVQALYQWHYTQASAREVILQFTHESNELKQADKAYFEKLVTGTIDSVTKIDETLEPYLDRKITALNPVELSILRMAVFELTQCRDVPYKVVINEALELAKEFGSEDGHKYVNGVLDAIKSKGVRP